MFVWLVVCVWLAVVSFVCLRCVLCLSVFVFVPSLAVRIAVRLFVYAFFFVMCFVCFVLGVCCIDRFAAGNVVFVCFCVLFVICLLMFGGYVLLIDVLRVILCLFVLCVVVFCLGCVFY